MNCSGTRRRCARMDDGPRRDRMRVSQHRHRRRFVRRACDGNGDRRLRQHDPRAGMYAAERALLGLELLIGRTAFLRIRKIVRTLDPTQAGERTDLRPTRLPRGRRDRLRHRRRKRIQQDRKAGDPEQCMATEQAEWRHGARV